MKLGYLMPLTSENIKTAASLGYDAIEAKVGWLDTPTLLDLEANLAEVRDALSEHKIDVSAVAIYGGTIEAAFDDAIAYWDRAIRLARALRCSVVCGLTGRDNTLTVKESLPVYARYFGPIAELAADGGVRVALEPWPGAVLGHGPYRWRNLATTPELWDRLFEAVPHEAIGIEYDPSHLAWQGIDYVRALRDYMPRIYHLHAKDIAIDQGLLSRVGVHGRGWWRFVIPGLGQIDWAELLDVLAEARYAGDLAVEHEDREYLDRRWNEGLRIALKTLRPLVEAYPL